MATNAHGRDPAHPCAVCRHHQTRCDASCIFAPYFPPRLSATVLHMSKLYSFSKIASIFQRIPLDQRARAADTFIWEANNRAQDPVLGTFGLIREVQHQNEQLKALLNRINLDYRHQYRSSVLQAYVDSVQELNSQQEQNLAHSETRQSGVSSMALHSSTLLLLNENEQEQQQLSEMAGPSGSNQASRQHEHSMAEAPQFVPWQRPDIVPDNQETVVSSSNVGVISQDRQVQAQGQPFVEEQQQRFEMVGPSESNQASRQHEHKTAEEPQCVPVEQPHSVPNNQEIVATSSNVRAVSQDRQVKAQGEPYVQEKWYHLRFGEFRVEFSVQASRQDEHMKGQGPQFVPTDRPHAVSSNNETVVSSNSVGATSQDRVVTAQGNLIVFGNFTVQETAALTQNRPIVAHGYPHVQAQAERPPFTTNTQEVAVPSSDVQAFTQCGQIPAQRPSAAQAQRPPFASGTQQTVGSSSNVRAFTQNEQMPAQRPPFVPEQWPPFASGTQQIVVSSSNVQAFTQEEQMAAERPPFVQAQQQPFATNSQEIPVSSVQDFTQNEQVPAQRPPTPPPVPKTQ